MVSAMRFKSLAYWPLLFVLLWPVASSLQISVGVCHKMRCAESLVGAVRQVPFVLTPRVMAEVSKSAPHILISNGGATILARIRLGSSGYPLLIYAQLGIDLKATNTSSSHRVSGCVIQRRDTAYQPPAAECLRHCDTQLVIACHERQGNAVEKSHGSKVAVVS